jgi:hypothetical protein
MFATRARVMHQRSVLTHHGLVGRLAGRWMSSPLAGKLFDETGDGLTPSYAVKGKRRYRYYVSRCLITGSANQSETGWRVPGPEIERRVATAAAMILSRLPVTWGRVCRSCGRQFGKNAWIDHWYHRAARGLIYLCLVLLASAYVWWRLHRSIN